MKPGVTVEVAPVARSRRTSGGGGESIAFHIDSVSGSAASLLNGDWTDTGEVTDTGGEAIYKNADYDRWSRIQSAMIMFFTSLADAKIELMPGRGSPSIGATPATYSAAPADDTFVDSVNLGSWKIVGTSKTV